MSANDDQFEKTVDAHGSCAPSAGSGAPAGQSFRDVARCPRCLTLGQMRPQFGNYVCERCDQAWGPDTLTHFMDAFEKGRVFERQNAEVSEPGARHAANETGAQPPGSLH